MDIREATSTDSAGIRSVADASLQASYADALKEDIVADAADEWYAEDRLTDRLDSDGVQFLVAVEDDDVVAFSESDLEGDATAAIEWLHVHPDHRGQGLGEQLLQQTEATLLEHGANRIEGRVLAENESGNEFYQNHGYARTGDRGLDIAGSTHTEHLYVKVPEVEGEPRLTEQRDTEDGPMWVAFDERERGSKGPFYTAYRTEDRSEKYGFYCANCGSVDASMNSMGEVMCGNCGNERKATRWDAAYL